MGHEVTIGGERLGSGKKMKAYLENYQRSTHDISRVWRSTMAPGTLVPFYTAVALPGDTFDIQLNCDVRTHPTIGPLFGSFKVQLDMFQIPIRLYNALLHMNATKIGMDMSKVYLPQLHLTVNNATVLKPLDNQQTNPSSILAYLGIRGAGWEQVQIETTRAFNAVTFLSYWDIYKQYYANKQEEIGVVIHSKANDLTLVSCSFTSLFQPNVNIPLAPQDPLVFVNVTLYEDSSVSIVGSNITSQTNPNSFYVKWKKPNGQIAISPWTAIFQDYVIMDADDTIVFYNPVGEYANKDAGFSDARYLAFLNPEIDQEPQLEKFPLSNIDDMKLEILRHPITTTPFIINENSIAPYGLCLSKLSETEPDKKCILYSQEGLGIKTYNSDLFNNWLSTEWIDGPDGISDITKVSTAGDSFTIDELNLSSKIYNMLSRIALSGGTYDDWLDAVYTHERTRSVENPMYIGGLIKNLVFEEVISNTQTEDQPLGTLAGRGRMGNKHKGGKIIAKIDEPSYIMGIVSLTPLIDYSQGNQWDVNLKSLNDLHKPALDEIGYQDLITDQMAWFETEMTADPNTPNFKSAGKQPAWINYMTDINIARGNFADPNQQMFMTLNRQYQAGVNTVGYPEIADLTTYIDPVKFNQIFADTRLDAQNFWVQISADITARRKMSAKVIPNL